jgi:two-component system, chemotaxis family, protein-glutamate methylesterase/glutaminase
MSASVLVVLHLAPHTPSVLPRILERSAKVPVRRADDRAHLRPGEVVVAVPDRHLIVLGHDVRTVEGAQENGHRPAIDALFRSVARWWGPRATGVVLTGALDDGSSGLLAIARSGGAAIVQDPAEATVAAMPAHALEAVPDAAVMTLEEIALHISGLRDEQPREADTAPDIEGEADLVEIGVGAPWTTIAGPPAGLTCPDCGGSLFESSGPTPRFRCRVGHAWTAAALAVQHSDELERALWRAARVIEDDVAVQQRLADRAVAGGHAHAASRISRRLADRTDLLRTLYSLIQGIEREGVAGDG